ATMTKENFTALNLNDIEPLKEKDDMSDEDMVNYLSHCMLDSKHPRSSIETLLHAFLPYKHVDHTHPDAIISIACADNGKEIAKRNTIEHRRRKNVRENKSNVSPSLTANIGTGKHNVPLILSEYAIRKLTPRESFNLQGVPEDFRLPNLANSHLYKQAGNS